jgi:glycogen phosphorylase
MTSHSKDTLARLAYNLRWAWHAPTADLFHSLAPDVWDATHNPIAVMRAVADAREVLNQHAERLAAARVDLENYLNRRPRVVRASRIAYFSAQFRVTDYLPIYAGGLGDEAGECLRRASDLGVPVIGVGLLYRYGHARQVADRTGEQREVPERLNTDTLPLLPVFAADGVPLEIGVPLPGRTLVARAWIARVGRVPLYLLDTDIQQNREDDRWITAYLNEGDSDTRLRQQMLLGIGGARLIKVLRRLGLEAAPELYQLNGADSAFVALELAAERMRTNQTSDFFLAHQQVTHTIALKASRLLAEGHEPFHPELIDAYLAAYRRELGLTHNEFMSLGRRDPLNHNEPFSTTRLAVRSAHARDAMRLACLPSDSEAILVSGKAGPLPGGAGPAFGEVTEAWTRPRSAVHALTRPRLTRIRPGMGHRD